MAQKLTLPAFGDIEPSRVLASDDLFAVIQDKFPISPGHAIIIALGKSGAQPAVSWRV